jgi:TRAP-type C4-dicarboxylate transport system permease large subunit
VLARTFSDAATAFLEPVVLCRGSGIGGGSGSEAAELARLSSGLVGLVVTAATCPLDPQVSAATFPFWKALGDATFSLRE